MEDKKEIKEEDKVLRSKATPTVEEVIRSNNDLQQSLFDKVEEKVDDSILEGLNREILKSHLLIGGKEIDLSKIGVFSKQVNAYEPRVPQKYYREIFRLNKGNGDIWKIPEGKIAHKPNIVGKWTKEIIYNRFDKRVLPSLEHLNPYERIGLRRLKHFQFLNKDGLLKFDKFIEEAIQVMEKCDNWYSFRVKLHEEHGVPYQTDLFKG